jgi:hypothetical protein
MADLLDEYKEAVKEGRKLEYDEAAVAVAERKR